MAFSEEMIQHCWDKARATDDQDPTVWRKDECGAWIRRDQYASESGEFGWIIANVSIAGADDIENLRPFHRINTYDRSERKAICHVTADRTGIAPTSHIAEPRNRRI